MLLNEKEIEMKTFPNVASVEFDALGTEIELRIVVNDNVENDLAKKDLKEAYMMYEYFTKIFSRFDSQSELSKLNNKPGTFNEASVEMIEAAVHCLKFNVDTGGIFDPRIIDTLESVGYKDDFKKGNFIFSDDKLKIDKKKLLSDDLKVTGRKIFFGARMDFSGMAKGFITDKIAQFFAKKGWKNFLIDSGGDMYLAGSDQEGSAWRIDVEGIVYEKLMLALSDKAIATSGISKRKWEIDGQRFHHLINPGKREQFLFDLKTVTVVARKTEDADVWAKTLFLMGKTNGIAYAKEHSIPAIFLDYKGGVWISPEVKKNLY